MNIYLQNEKDFEHNGLGFLKDVLSANITDNLNGDYSLFFEYKLNGQLSEYIQNENIVKCKVADGTKQLFIIKSVVKTYDSIQVTCKHIFYQLLDNFVEDVYPTNLSPQQFLTWILDRTNYTNNFKVYSDIFFSKSARYIRKNPVEIILGDNNSMVNLFGGELKRNNFDIYFNKQVGNDNGVKLIIGKNITGINITTDTSSVYTRIMPQGFDGLFLPEKYIDSPLINNYVNPKIYKADFSDIKYDIDDEDAYHTLDEAYNALRNATNDLFENGIDKPTINIKINWIELSKTNEYKTYSNLEKVSLGDTLTCDLLGLTYKTRVIKTTYDPLSEKVTSFELGAPKADIGTVQNIIKKQLDILPTSILESARNNATELLTQAMGGFVYKTQNELFIMDTNDVKTATKVWRWNLNGLGYSNNGINGPYETAITQDGQIVADFITAGKLNTDVIEGYDALLLKVANLTSEADTLAKIELSLEEINQKINSVTDISTSEKGTGTISLTNVLTSELLYLQIYPTSLDLSYLHLKFNFENSRLTSRDVIFQNENSKIRFSLPCDLLYLNDNVKDEFILNYDTQKMYVIHRIGILNNEKYELEEPYTEYFDYNPIILTEGNYSVYMPSFSNAYIYARALASNIYTSQYATRIELDSSISLTKTNILETVNENVTLINGDIDSLSGELEIQSREVALRLKSSDFTSNAIIGLINNRDGTSTAKIEATNINLTGYVTATDLSGSGTTTINGSNIKTGTIDASKVTVTNLSASNINSGTLSCDRLSGGTINGQAIYGGTISGSTITCNSGTIGGWTVGASGFYNTNSRSSSVYSDGRCSFANNYGWINCGSSGTWINGNGTSYPAYILDSYTRSRESGDSIIVHASYGRLVLRSDVGLGDGTNKSYSSIYIYASNGGAIRTYTTGNNIQVGGSVVLIGSSGGVYAGTSNSGWAKVATSSSGVSSKVVKTDITDFTFNDYQDALSLLSKIKMHHYKYKYNVSDLLKKGDEHYGFIIDDVENIKGYDKFLKFESNEMVIDNDNLRGKLKKEEKTITIKNSDANIFNKYLLTVCKALQQEIDFLKRKIGD